MALSIYFIHVLFFSTYYMASLLMLPSEHGSVHPSCVRRHAMAAFVSDKHKLVVSWEKELAFTVTLHTRQNT